MGKHAKVLTTAELRQVVEQASNTRYSDRNRAMILLSFKAGLRAAEIAGLEWPMVLGPNGKLVAHIVITASIAKNGSGRHIPMNPELGRALAILWQQLGKPRSGPIIASERGHHMTPRSVVNWFAKVYRDLEFIGCSSHSGRRTFITQSARMISKAGGSLRDIQELAGHRALTTTERYIEGDREAQRRLIRLL